MQSLVAGRQRRRCTRVRVVAQHQREVPSAMQVGQHYLPYASIQPSYRSEYGRLVLCRAADNSGLLMSTRGTFVFSVNHQYIPPDSHCENIKDFLTYVKEISEFTGGKLH